MSPVASVPRVAPSPDCTVTVPPTARLNVLSAVALAAEKVAPPEADEPTAASEIELPWPAAMVGEPLRLLTLVTSVRLPEVTLMLAS